MVFHQEVKGHLRQPPINVLDKEILSSDGEILKLDDQKNGWKGVCVYQEHNGDVYQEHNGDVYQEHNGDEKFSPVRALGR